MYSLETRMVKDAGTMDAVGGGCCGFGLGLRMCPLVSVISYQIFYRVPYKKSKYPFDFCTRYHPCNAVTQLC